MKADTSPPFTSICAPFRTDGRAINAPVSPVLARLVSVLGWLRAVLDEALSNDRVVGRVARRLRRAVHRKVWREQSRHVLVRLRVDVRMGGRLPGEVDQEVVVRADDVRVRAIRDHPTDG